MTSTVYDALEENCEGRDGEKNRNGDASSARADERMRTSAKAPAITIARIFFKKITAS